MATVIPAAPASAITCADHRKNHTNAQTDSTNDTYYMGDSVTKANLDCNDVNVSWTNHSADFRGQYYHSGLGVWLWNASGAQSLSSGNQSPWRVIISSVLPGTQVRVGSTEQHAWWNWKRSDWQV